MSGTHWANFGQIGFETSVFQAGEWKLCFEKFHVSFNLEWSIVILYLGLFLLVHTYSPHYSYRVP